MLEDIGVITGGQMISDDLGIKLENVTLDMLGSAKRVTIDKESTTIVDGAGSAESIKARADAIRGQIERSDSEYRSEEHTSELQSLMRISYAVFCLKKKTKQKD